MFWESPGQPWPTNLKEGFLMPWLGFFVRCFFGYWSIVSTESLHLNCIWIFIHRFIFIKNILGRYIIVWFLMTFFLDTINVILVSSYLFSVYIFPSKIEILYFSISTIRALLLCYSSISIVPQPPTLAMVSFYFPGFCHSSRVYLPLKICS